MALNLTTLYQIAPLMVLVQRLTLLAANIWDGQVLIFEESKKKEIDDKENGTQKSKKSSQLTPLCKQYAILSNYAMVTSGDSDFLFPNIETELAREMWDSENSNEKFSEVPTPLEFFSYCLNFQTILAGPPVTFRDYRIYIEGREAEDKNLNPKQRAYFVSYYNYNMSIMREALALKISIEDREN
ncbi:hypothetical protein ACTXT7_004453 [Hymenolepis weldensis]